MKTSSLPKKDEYVPKEDRVVLVQEKDDGTFDLVLATVDQIADAKLKEL